MQLSHKYEVERMELKAKASDFHRKPSEMGSKQQERDNFTYTICRFMEM